MSVGPIVPATYAGEIGEAARQGGWNLQHLSPCASGARPWLHRAGDTADAPRLYLSSGIHGDEFSGPIALLEMLRRPGFFRNFDVTIFPILNPDGLARGTRENADGIDLNRDYRYAKSQEIRSHKEVLDGLAPFAAAMYFHEDFEEAGAYLYELNDSNLPVTLGREMIEAMAWHVPIDLRPEIEEVAASGGVLLRRDLMKKFGSFEEREDWPEAIYLSLKHTRVSYTSETPMLQPLEDRVAAQIAAFGVLMDAVGRAGEGLTELRN